MNISQKTPPPFYISTENLPSLTFTLDGRIVTANQEAVNLFPAVSLPILNKNIADVLYFPPLNPNNVSNPTPAFPFYSTINKMRTYIFGGSSYDIHLISNSQKDRGGIFFFPVTTTPQASNSQPSSPAPLTPAAPLSPVLEAVPKRIKTSESYGNSEVFSAHDNQTAQAFVENPFQFSNSITTVFQPVDSASGLASSTISNFSAIPLPNKENAAQQTNVDFFEVLEISTKEIKQVENQKKVIDRSAFRILVADDNEAQRKIIDRILKSLGFSQITFAVDGEDAVSTFSSGLFDIVFMDMEMPKKNGAQATFAIRQLEAERGQQETPILGWTTLDENKFQEHVKEAFQTNPALNKSYRYFDKNRPNKNKVHEMLNQLFEFIQEDKAIQEAPKTSE